MLSRASVFALAAIATIGNAIPWSKGMSNVHYKIPESMMRIKAQDDSCIYPEGFDISGFILWAPASNNTNSPLIEFTYSDVSTGISTECMYNTSSVNVGPEGLTPRYACDNQIVEFIWDADDSHLTIVEKACPESGGDMEASGVIYPDLTCVQTNSDSWEGQGTACYPKTEILSANFTSLSPAPPSVASY